MTTDFSQIKFDSYFHRYSYQGRSLNNVTGYLKQFQKPFDRDGVAKRVAERDGRKVAEVLAEWDLSGERARVLGVAVHQHIRNTLCAVEGQFSFEPFLSMNVKAPEVITFDRLWAELANAVICHPEQVEWVIGDVELGIAGTVDAFLFSQATGQYHIWDWKTGKFDVENRFERLLPPFDDLSASKLNIYSLQVSLYRLIIERNTSFKTGDSYIVHLGQEGHSVHRALDLREKLLDCLVIPF